MHFLYMNSLPSLSLASCLDISMHFFCHALVQEAFVFLIVSFLRGEPAGHWALWIFLLFSDPINKPPPFYVFVLQPSQRSLPFLTLEGSVAQSFIKKAYPGMKSLPAACTTGGISIPPIYARTSTRRTTQSGRGTNYRVDSIAWHHLLSLRLGLCLRRIQRMVFDLDFSSFSFLNHLVLFFAIVTLQSLPFGCGGLVYYESALERRFDVEFPCLFSPGALYPVFRGPVALISYSYGVLASPLIPS